MRTTLSLLFIIPFLSTTAFAQSDQDDGFPEIEFSGFIDARVFQSSKQESWMDGGLGKSRFGGDVTGDNETGINISEVSLLIEPQFSWSLSGYVHLQYTPEQNQTK